MNTPKNKAGRKSNLVVELHQAVLSAVQKAWPKLVAAEQVKEMARRGLISGNPAGVVYNERRRETKHTQAKQAKQVKRVSKLSPSAALAKYGSKSAAARALGIAESTFRDRLKSEAAKAKPPEVKPAEAAA